MLSIEHVRARLRRPLPGHAAQALMMPRPRGGRLPARGRLRNAGVLILLFPRDETELALVLIRRAAHADRPDPHSGQLALPGGRQETGESLSATALRETAEEVGVDRCRIRLLAALTPLEIPVSGHRVQPFIGYCAPTPRFRPDPSEVAGIVQWPLHRLLDGGSIRTERPRGARPAWRTIPYFEAEGHRVWGATAMILSELRVLLRRPA